jgi:soluble lytic murein transglycosylase-like protein
MIDAAAAANDVPATLLGRLLWQESKFDPEALSPGGDIGIAQFQQATADQYGIDPAEPAEAIPGAARYLRDLYAQFGGSWRLALAAYNWGPGNLKAAGSSLTAAPASVQRYANSIVNDALGSEAV